ncbi:hypothetical protein J6590_096140, partial [Homalodisca vitripennis]
GGSAIGSNFSFLIASSVAREVCGRALSCCKIIGSRPPLTRETRHRRFFWGLQLLRRIYRRSLFQIIEAFKICPDTSAIGLQQPTDNTASTKLLFTSAGPICGVSNLDPTDNTASTKLLFTSAGPIYGVSNLDPTDNTASTKLLFTSAGPICGVSNLDVRSFQDLS